MSLTKKYVYHFVSNNLLFQHLVYRLSMITNLLTTIIFFSALGTIGAIFVCAVTAVKYLEGKYTVNPEFVQ